MFILGHYKTYIMLTFKETQKFTQWWLWLILIAIGISPLIGIYTQLIKKEPLGDAPLSDVGLILYSIFIFATIGVFLRLTLKTEINSKGIQMNYIPFVKKEIDWKDIKTAEVVNYGFVGGWGIRWNTAYGTVYNTRGNKGVAIALKNGKKIGIGTQKEEEMQEVIEKAKKMKLI